MMNLHTMLANILIYMDLCLRIVKLSVYLLEKLNEQILFEDVWNRNTDKIKWNEVNGKNI